MKLSVLAAIAALFAIIPLKTAYGVEGASFPIPPSAIIRGMNLPEDIPVFDHSPAVEPKLVLLILDQLSVTEGMFALKLLWLPRLVGPNYDLDIAAHFFARHFRFAEVVGVSRHVIEELKPDDGSFDIRWRPSMVMETDSSLRKSLAVDGGSIDQSLHGIDHDIWTLQDGERLSGCNGSEGGAFGYVPQSDRGNNQGASKKSSPPLRRKPPSDVLKGALIGCWIGIVVWICSKRPKQKDQHLRSIDWVPILASALRRWWYSK